MTSDPSERERSSDQFAVVATYFHYVLALIRPGHKLPVFTAHKNEPAELEAWRDEELDLLLEEGRRQLDSQSAMRDDLRTRAQWIVTLGVPIVIAIASTQPTVWKASLGVRLLWAAGLVLTAYGILGSAAILTVRLEYGTIDTALMSSFTGEKKRRLAAGYTRAVRPGANTNATLLTLFWQSVLWLLLGGALALDSWLIAR